jgi:hypothetical protein
MEMFESGIYKTVNCYLEKQVLVKTSPVVIAVTEFKNIPQIV